MTRLVISSAIALTLMVILLHFTVLCMINRVLLCVHGKEDTNSAIELADHCHQRMHACHYITKVHFS